MKYLRIHKLIWLSFVLIYLIPELIIMGMVYIGYIAWNFHLPKDNLWYKYHKFFESVHYEGLIVYMDVIEDKTILDTIIRRYHIMFENKEYNKRNYDLIII